MQGRLRPHDAGHGARILEGEQRPAETNGHGREGKAEHLCDAGRGVVLVDFIIWYHPKGIIVGVVGEKHLRLSFWNQLRV
jgi:hypothetical protein